MILTATYGQDAPLAVCEADERSAPHYLVPTGAGECGYGFDIAARIVVTRKWIGLIIVCISDSNLIGPPPFPYVLQVWLARRGNDGKIASSIEGN